MEEGARKDSFGHVTGALSRRVRSSETGKSTKQRLKMKVLKKLQNPFVLVGQGFVLGGILFFATHPESLLASPVASQSADVVIASPTDAR